MIKIFRKKKKIKDKVFSSDRIDDKVNLKKSFQLKPLIVVIIGIFIFLSAELFRVYLKGDLELSKDILDSLLRTIVQFSIPLITAGIIACVFSWPDLKNYIKNIVFEILTNSNYIGLLESENILKIRKKCTKLLFTDVLKKDEKVIESLANLENEIISSLQNLYYKKYRVDIVCTENKKKGYLEKKLKYSLTIKNPKDEEDEYNFDFYNFLFDLSTVEDKNKLRQLKKFNVTLSENGIKSKPMDLKNTYNFKVYENEISNIGQCRYQTNLVDKDDKIFSTKVVDELIIDIEEIRLLPIEDTIHVHRLFYPAEKYLFTYKYIGNPTLECYGSIFGTITEIDSEGLLIENKGNVSIIKCDRWMLKSNGSFVMLKQK